MFSNKWNSPSITTFLDSVKGGSGYILCCSMEGGHCFNIMLGCWDNELAISNGPNFAFHILENLTKF